MEKNEIKTNEKIVICPLRHIAVCANHNLPAPLYNDCIEELCGWWNKETNCCAVLEISNSLRKIARKK